MAKPWFRFYRRTVNNPKAQRLSPELFKAWVNLLCATDDDGRLPKIDDLAFTLRVGAEVIHEWLTTLTGHRLFVAGRNGVTIANDWEDHNYESDCDPTAAERKRRQRDRTKQSRVTNRDSHAYRTDTESDIEQNRTSEPSLPSVGSARAKPKKGTRWDDKFFKEIWITDVQRIRENANLPDIDLRLEALRFSNYWAAKSGAAATKLDWYKTFENWCLKAEGARHGTGLNGPNRSPGILHSLAAKRREALEREGEEDLRD